MKAIEVVIKDKTFKLGFGLEVFLKLGEAWGLDTLDEVNAKFVEFANLDPTQPLKLSSIKSLSEIIEATIAANADNAEKITAVEIRSLSLPDFEKLLTEFFTAFSQSLPKAPAEEKK